MFVGGEADWPVAPHYRVRSLRLRTRPRALPVSQQPTEVHWDIRAEGKSRPTAYGMICRVSLWNSNNGTQIYGVETLPGEAELVSERTGLPGETKRVKRFERSNGLDTTLYKNIPFIHRNHWFRCIKGMFLYSIVSIHAAAMMNKKRGLAGRFTANLHVST